jgi:NH3-dependent NAD+ synthetase
MPRIHVEPAVPPAVRGGSGNVATLAKPALAPRAKREEVDDNAEIYAALTLGVRDYVRKNGFDTVVLGLSGGIDSALTACVAADALGAANVVGVSMPSPYTSQASQADAESLAKTLGMSFQTLADRRRDERLRGALRTSFAGRERDITEENLQAGSAATR